MRLRVGGLTMPRPRLPPGPSCAVLAGAVPSLAVVVRRPASANSYSGWESSFAARRAAGAGFAASAPGGLPRLNFSL
jgi:hypothetical protein